MKIVKLHARRMYLYFLFLFNRSKKTLIIGYNEFTFLGDKKSDPKESVYCF